MEGKVRRLSESEVLERAAEGVPNFLLRRAALGTRTEDLPEGGDFLYVIRVKDEKDPQITVFLFPGDEHEAVAAIRKVMQKPVGSRPLR